MVETQQLKSEISEKLTRETTKPTALSIDKSKSIAIVKTISNEKCNPKALLQKNEDKILVICETIYKSEQHLNVAKVNTKRNRNRRKLESNEPPKKIGRPSVLTPEERRQRRRALRQGICTICGKYSADLGPHMRVHNPVSVECDYCNKNFTSKQGLLAHFKTHFKQRFVCI